MSRPRIFRRAKKGQCYPKMQPPSPEAWAAAEARRADIKACLMRYAPLRADIDAHVQHVLPYVAHAWELHRPELGSSWEVFSLQPCYFHAGKLIAKVINRGLALSKKERRRRAEQGEPVRFTSTDYRLPGGDVVVDLMPAPPPPDPVIAEAAALLRRWLSERTATTAAEHAALEVMTARAHGDDEISLADAGRKYRLSRERVRQVYLQLEQDFRDAYPELKELLREAA